MTEPSPKVTVTLHEGVGDILVAWRDSLNNLPGDGTATTYEELADLRGARLEATEQLLHVLLRRLIPNKYDGDLHLYRVTDMSPDSMGFRYERGLTGGILFEADKPEWSTHT